MIARSWSGKTLKKDADTYYEYLLETGVKQYRGTEGNRGVIILRSFIGDSAEFTLLSFWDSYDAIKKFAGDNIEEAVFYPQDDKFLVEKDLTVYHYDVLDYEIK